MVGVSHVLHGKDGSNWIPQCFVASMMLVSLMEIRFWLNSLHVLKREGFQETSQIYHLYVLIYIHILYRSPCPESLPRSPGPDNLSTSSKQKYSQLSVPNLKLCLPSLPASLFQIWEVAIVFVVKLYLTSQGHCYRCGAIWSGGTMPRWYLEDGLATLHHCETAEVTYELW